VRKGDAGVCQCGDPRSDPGYHFVWNPRGSERERLFSSSSEDEGVATLEANDDGALLRQSNEQSTHFFQREESLSGATTDIVSRDLSGGEVQKCGIYEGVVNDGIRPGQQPCTAYGQEFGIARAGADEVDRSDGGRRVHA
jgi:hypothetical protein